MFRRTIATVSVGLATAFGLTVAADSAAAGTVTQTCAYTHGVGGKTVSVTITAPATVTSGVPAPVYIKIEDQAPWTGDPLVARHIVNAAHVRLGGAASGEVRVQPLTNTTAIPTGAHWYAERTQQFTFTTPGTVSLAVHGYGVPLYYWCRTPSGQEPPVAETVTVLS